MDKKTESIMRFLVIGDITVEEALNALQISTCGLMNNLFECAFSIKSESLNNYTIDFMKNRTYQNLKKKIANGEEKCVSKSNGIEESIRFFSELAFHTELALTVKLEIDATESKTTRYKVIEPESETMQFEIHGQKFAIVKDITKHSNIDEHALRLSLDGIIIHSTNWTIDKKNKK